MNQLERLKWVDLITRDCDSIIALNEYDYELIKLAIEKGANVNNFYSKFSNHKDFNNLIESSIIKNIKNQKILSSEEYPIMTLRIINALANIPDKNFIKCIVDINTTSIVHIIKLNINKEIIDTFLQVITKIDFSQNKELCTDLSGILFKDENGETNIIPYYGKTSPAQLTWDNDIPWVKKELEDGDISFALSIKIDNYDEIENIEEVAEKIVYYQDGYKSFKNPFLTSRFINITEDDIIDFLDRWFLSLKIDVKDKGIEGSELEMIFEDNKHFHDILSKYSISVLFLKYFHDLLSTEKEEEDTNSFSFGGLTRRVILPGTIIVLVLIILVITIF